MTMKRIVAAAVLAAPVMITGPAVAQTVDASANSQSVAQNQVIVGSGAGGGKLEYDGSYSVRSNPDVVPPMISGGANPCVVGMSAGGSVVGFGMSAGGSWNDLDCERRNLSIVLLNAGKQFDDPRLAAAGIEVLCHNDEVAAALEVAGRPCAVRRATQRAARPADRQTAGVGTSDFDWINDPRTGR